MPVPKDYQEIISAIIEKTDQGALDWIDENLHVSVNVDLSTFRLWSGSDEHTDEGFVAFGLYGASGKVLDSWYLDESDADYQVVFNLYRAAKRHANGVPSLLHTLTAQISSLKKKN